MANLDFFATRPDFEQLFAFLFGETDFHVFESYSEFGKPIREFASFADLCATFDVGQDKHGNGTAALLQLSSPSVMPKPQIERIDLDPGKCDGFAFRFRMSGYGLVQLYLGGVHDRVITKSHYGHFSERGAARWGDVSHVNWSALSKLSGKVQRHIHRKLTVAKVPGRPVLAGAYKLSTEGYELKEAAQTPWAYAAAAAGST
jgi:hypothetical protein